MLGLYLHVPFCAAICHYCNFNRGLFDPDLKARYVGALASEIGRAAPGAADTIFFGGGTPSLLAPAEIGRLVEACARRFALAADAEITLEANPETVTPETLRGFRAAGVNRISVGVQSFRDEELARLGRQHDAARARAALAAARPAGFDNVSADLMMWLPGQRVAEWLVSVDALVTAAPDHVSFYVLELYPNAPLREEMARGGWSLPPDEEAEAMYLEGLSRLEAAGYGQYEISNAARPGRASRHNLKYWSDGEWLGFGCGAHSTRDGARWRNVSGTTEYMARVEAGIDPAVDRRSLDPGERLGDALFTGLRLTAGVDVEEIGRRYGVNVWARFGPDLEPFLAAGLLLREGRRLRLAPRGMLLANEVMGVFVEAPGGVE